MRKLSVLTVLFLLILTACATTQGQRTWDQLTQDEQARVVVFTVQDSLNGYWDMGKAYIAVHPDKAADWKTKIVPAFDVANTTLKGLIDSKTNLTVAMVEGKMTPLVNKIVVLLAGLGVLK